MTEYSNKIIEIGGHKVHESVFTQGFVSGCDMKICGGQCCNAGVYLDKDFKQVILKHKDIILAEMNDEQIKNIEKWFDEEEIEDSDFPSGIAAGTSVYTDGMGVEKCVFNDHRGWCSLQVAAVNNGMHKWAIKPSYCIMYPITISEGVITYDDDHSEDLNYCGRHRNENFTQTAFDGTAEEIKYVLGEDFYELLMEYYKANFPEHYNKKHQPQLYQINLNKSA